jgi:uncharacterized protein
MGSEIIYDTIKRTVHAYLPDARVLLFGSHARGNYDRHSDYDLLVITPNLLTPREKVDWSSELNRAIVKAIHAPIDLLLYSEDEISEKRQLPGHIVRSAMREGIAL